MTTTYRLGLGLATLALLGLAAAHPAQADPIPTLYNTGVDSSGAALPVGTADPHYTNITPAAGGAYVIGYPYGVQPTSAYQWISVDTGDGSSINGGNYTVTYETTFDLTGFDPSTASISGQWATDNFGLDIVINGFSTGITAADFTSLHPFTLPGGHYVSGVNTLDFVWQNVGGPGALLVDFTDATAGPAGPVVPPTPGSVPEPSPTGSLGLGVLGVLGLTLKARRRKTVAA